MLTDWDPPEQGRPLGVNRIQGIVRAIEHARTGSHPAALIEELRGLQTYDELCRRCEEFGVFTNMHTLEVDLFAGDFIDPIVETLREPMLSEEREGWVDKWEDDPASLNAENYLKLIEAVGKGRFAQRLSSRIEGLEPPAYIASAIRFVAERV